MTDKIFAEGIYFKRNDNAPDFAIGKLSINTEQSRPFFKEHVKDVWLNLEVKRSKGGKYYVELDTWEPKKEAPPESPPPAMDDLDDDLPF